MKSPMSVIPFGAVFETGTTGTPAACASGSAAVAVLERVGPMIAATLSLLMKRWKTAIPCSFVDASSSTTASSFTPLRAPLRFTSSTAARIPAFCVAPYTAAGPVMLSAAPILTVCCASAGVETAARKATTEIRNVKRMGSPPVRGRADLVRRRAACGNASQRRTGAGGERQRVPVRRRGGASVSAERGGGGERLRAPRRRRAVQRGVGREIAEVQDVRRDAGVRVDDGVDRLDGVHDVDLARGDGRRGGPEVRGDRVPQG